MSQPLNKVGRELVLDLINRTNQLHRPLTLTDVQFSAPVALETEPGLRNTQLTVYPAPNSNYIRSKVVTYWRLDVDQLLSGELATIGIAEDAVIENTTDLIQILNDRYGLLLTDEDVVYEDYDLVSLPAQVTLTMAPGSYAYLGSVVLTLAYDLSQIIYVNLLEGLEYPADTLIENATPFYVTEEGFLLTGTGIAGSFMTTANNVEAEGFIGIHRTGAGDPYVTPVGNRYNLPLADTRNWSFSFGVGLLETHRVTELLAGYDVSLEVRHESNYAMTFILERQDAGLIWNIEGSEASILDNEPAGSLQVAQNTQRTVFYNDYFPDVPTNSVGAHLGLFTFTLRLVPKQAIFVKPIELVVEANITAA